MVRPFKNDMSTSHYFLVWRQMIRYLDVNFCFYFSLFHQTNIIGHLFFFFLLNNICKDFKKKGSSPRIIVVPCPSNLAPNNKDWSKSKTIESRVTDNLFRTTIEDNALLGRV